MIARQLKRTRISLGIAIPINQATILSKVGTPSPTSPSANKKVTILITVFSLHLKI
jgi:hypothetical protein